MSSIILQQLMRQRVMPLFHSIRPPNAFKPVVTSRLLTTHRPLLVARVFPGSRAPLLRRSYKDNRLLGIPINSKSKANIIYQVRLGLYWAVMGWTVVFAVWVAGIVLRHDWLERQYPTPSDWNLYIRMMYHDAERESDTDDFVNWARTGSRYRACLKLCETLKKASEGLKEHEEGGIDIPGAGKAGLDITEKSEPWRRGYFTVLMGCAKAAENMEGYMNDRTRNLSFRADQVIGPSNPFPRPVLPGSPKAPLEENCDPAFDSPHTYYVKILTTKGFTNKQRMDASLAYAYWLDFKGLHDTATEMYKWALDIACSPLDDPASIVNRQTGVIQPNATQVSSNILTASTAMASHFIQTDNIPAALNTYLSVLRARRAADAVPPNSDHEKPDPDFSLGTFESLMKFIATLPTRSQYPPAPPSGDDPFLRSRSQKCDEAAIMLYVGEILFASKAERDGLSWTRDAVKMAEDGLEDAWGKAARRKTCNQCLETGLENWQKMVRRLAAEEVEQNSTGGLLPDKLKTVWKGRSSSPASATLQEKTVWQQEDRMVTEKLEKFHAKQLDERLQAGVIRAGRLALL